MVFRLFRHVESTLSGSDSKETQSHRPKHQTYTTDRFTKNAECDTLLNSPPLSALNATKNIMTSSSVIIAVVENIGGRFSGSLRRGVAMMLSTRSTEFMASFDRSEGFVAFCGAPINRQIYGICWTLEYLD